MASSPDKTVNISLLLDFYGSLLTERQCELLDYYYNDDLSLSEISEISGITRQGVRDAVKKGESLLIDTENKLGLLARFQKSKDDLSFIISRLEEIKAENHADVDDIIERAKFLI